MNKDSYYFKFFVNLLFLLYIVTYVKLLYVNPKYLMMMNFYLKLFLGVMLVLFFNPNKKVRVFSRNTFNLSKSMLFSMTYSAGFIILFSVGLDKYFEKTLSYYNIVKDRLNYFF